MGPQSGAGVSEGEELSFASACRLSVSESTAMAPAWRIFTAGLSTETNTFAPIPTDREAFTVHRPGEHPDSPTSLTSAPLVILRRLAAEGSEPIELFEGTVANAEPAGLVSRAVYESLRDEILDQMRAAMPLHAVVLGLHGAMVAHGYDDVEGDILTRAR
eukprot:COSAG04_NODE_10372_length_782_cov_1.865300_1_plen_159_part_10